MKLKTFSQKPADVSRTWYVVDASEAPLGRLASQVAKLLVGKDKPSYTPHVDGGDYVIVINSDNLVVTGGKEDKKVYYRHTGHPGGIKETKLNKMKSEAVVEKAVRGMIPVNKLRPGRLARLKVYTDDNHGHNAQKPVKVSVKEGK